MTRLTRRDFTLGGLAAATGTVSLHVLGCGQEPDPVAAKLPDQPVQAGPVARYLDRGVYEDLLAHNIWLYSDGNYLVALTAVCPHQYCIVKYDRMTDVYACPCHRSRFAPEGMVKKGSKAQTSLERCRIRAVDVEGEPTVVVDPKLRYRFEQNQWSMLQSMLRLRA